MVRYKGEVRPKNTERDFPNIVRFLVPDGGLGRKLDEMVVWHREHGLELRHGVGSRSSPEWYVHYCFLNPENAEAFRSRFDGEQIEAVSKLRRARAGRR